MISRSARSLSHVRVVAKRAVASAAKNRSHLHISPNVLSFTNAPNAPYKLNRRFLSTSPKSETLSFQAETRKLLDIVTNSIYTDKDVFLRELISNASDALEKYRYLQVQGSVREDGDGTTQPLQIKISLDEEKGQMIILDNGIGMTREELISNLGTIARSGSKAFVEDMVGAKDAAQGGKEGIIGQFGVGFYAAFMVSDLVTVESISAPRKVAEGEGEVVSPNSAPAAYRWTSDGTGEYTIEQLDTPPADLGTHGTKITLHLKRGGDNNNTNMSTAYTQAEKVKSIIGHYSSFITYPIMLQDAQVNTTNAIWLQSRSSLADTDYAQFFAFLNNNNPYEEFSYKLHLSTDAPIDLKVLCYVPRYHKEKFGLPASDPSLDNNNNHGLHNNGQPGLNLYCKKVLIEAKCSELLPDWLHRMVIGVVDSEDLPLSLSRETTQNRSLLLRKIREVLTRRLLKLFAEEMNKDRRKYEEEFFTEYALFLKQGVTMSAQSQYAGSGGAGGTDFLFMEQIAKLLLFDSSLGPVKQPVEQGEGEEGKVKEVEYKLSSLDEYIARCVPEQKAIYYLLSPNRDSSLYSPYYEIFKQKGIEVLFVYHTIDEFVMMNLRKYSGRELINIETADQIPDLSAFPDKEEKDGKDGKDKDSKVEANDDNKDDKDKKVVKGGSNGDEAGLAVLTEAEGIDLCLWLRVRLGASRVKDVKVTHRLRDTPAIVTGHQSQALRTMLKITEQMNQGKATSSADNGQVPLIPPQVLEINTNHPLIKQLYRYHTQSTLGGGNDSDHVLQLLVEQVYDNACVAAGLLDDPRSMLARVNEIMLETLREKNNNNKAGEKKGETAAAVVQEAEVVEK